MEKELYSNRSVSACVKTAYTLFVCNAKTILKKTWLPVLAYAIVLTGMVFFYIPDKYIHELGMSAPWVTYTLMAATQVLLFVCSIWLTAKTFSLLNGVSTLKLFVRSIVLNVFLLLYLVLASSLVSGSLRMLVSQALVWLNLPPETNVAVFLLTLAFILLLMTVCMIPLDYASTKYVAAPSTPLLHVVSKDFAVGMRHWGFYFLNKLISSIIVSLITIVAMIPFMILMTAQIFNQLGMMGGDADGAPGYFLILFVVVSILTFAIIAYEMIWYMMVGYFAYGSIYKQEEERQKHQKVIKDDETTENTLC